MKPLAPPEIVIPPLVVTMPFTIVDELVWFDPDGSRRIIRVQRPYPGQRPITTK